MNTADTVPSAGALAYRPDIDGLRAVAVLAVIAYHARRELMPGGFCGVDVFFVISGFLITGIILGEISAGRFSLVRFYTRRIRRIFPALGVMLALCLLLGHRVLLPEEYRLMGKHVVASVGFVENVLLYRSLGYFAWHADQIPLLHLWSLAVEEQFYAVFPLVVMALVRLRCRLSWAFLAMLAASLAGSRFASLGDPDAGFYLAWYRAWELLVGSLLAVWLRNGSLPRSRWAVESMSACGAFGLLFSLMWLRYWMAYPSWRAGVPVASAALLIAAGKDALFNRLVLSNKVAVGIGLVSYPLYLFHWPIFAFLHIRDGIAVEPEAAELVAALVATVVLTLLTYAWIERPIRHYQGNVGVVVLCAVMASIGLVGELVRRGVIDNGGDSPGVLQVRAAIADVPFVELPQGTQTEKFVFRIGGRGRTTLLYGDSMVLQVLPRLVARLRDAAPAGRGAMAITAGGSLPIPGYRFRRAAGDAIAMDARFRRALDEDASIDRVILLGCWLPYVSRASGSTVDGHPMHEEEGRQAAIRALESLMRDVVARGKQVTLVLGFPVHPRLDPNAFLQRGIAGVRAIEPRAVTAEDVFAVAPGGREMTAAMAARARELGVAVIDPMPLLCPDGTCVGEDADGPIRHDTRHLRATYVRDRVDWLDHLLAP